MTDTGNSFEEPDVTDHPPVEEMAAYLSGRLSPDERARLESHLSQCRDCREEVTSARKLMGDPVSSARLWLIPGVAAAVLFIGILFRLPAASDRERTRISQHVSGRETIDVVSPHGDVNRAAVSFTWRSAGYEALYAVNLSDSTGNTVWETQTPDTSIALPRSVTLASGAVYLWYIDASSPNGVTVTSGVHSFRASR